MMLSKLNLLDKENCKSRVVIIPEFKIFDVSLVNGTVEFLHKEIEFQTYNHFSAVLLHDNSPWEEANRFLISLIKDKDLYIKPPSHQNLYRKALALKKFADFIVSENIDYKECSSRTRSPLRRFRVELNDKVMRGRLSANTAKLYMSNLVKFYQFLISYEGVQFTFPPWEEKEQYISYFDAQGRRASKSVKSYDVAKFPGTNRAEIETAAYEGKIIDGGVLRPLDEEEQLMLVEALKEINHIEMTLIHLHGLLSGARKQTILTYRRNQFLGEAKPNQFGMVCLNAGGSSSSRLIADCKDSRNVNKSELIWVPVELYYKTQIYINSPRALARLEKAKEKYKNIKSDDQYVFLSKFGNPLYIGKTDVYKGSFKQPPNGQALETFINKQLKPILKRKGFQSHYKFHDTRATAGMNYVRFGLALFNNSQSDLSKPQVFEELFRLVHKLLNHSSLRTTEQYLAFDGKFSLISEVQHSYEKHLKLLMECLK